MMEIYSLASAFGLHSSGHSYMTEPQLSKDMPISAARRYWIGTRTRLTEPGEDQSMKCYGQRVLRTDIIDRLWTWSNQQKLHCGAVKVFGGLVRREIGAHHELDSMLQATAPEFMCETFLSHKGLRGSPFHVSETCFVREDTDVDIFFETAEDINEWIATLRKSFHINCGLSSVDETRYHGCRVWHLEVSQDLQIFGPRLVVRLDLVTRAAPEVVLMPDFSVNQLQIDVQNTLGLFTDRTPPSRSPLIEAILRAKQITQTIDQIEARQTDVLLYSWDYYRYAMVDHCRALDALYPAPDRNALLQIHRPSAQVALDESWDPYIAREPSTCSSCSYYAQYVSRLIRYRLRKMLADGWTVRNMAPLVYNDASQSLSMQCGHEWSFHSGDLQVRDESGIRIRCPVCQSVDTIARNFVA